MKTQSCAHWRRGQSCVLNDSVCKILSMAIYRYLAELEMRLHLMAEELDAAIEDESARALLRVPGAVQEVSHLKASILIFTSQSPQSVSSLNSVGVRNCNLLVLRDPSKQQVS